MDNQGVSERQQLLLKWLENVGSEKTRLYIEERVINQIDWYQKKSRKCKNSYLFWSTISIILSGIIPVISVLADGTFFFKILIAFLGASVTGISAYLNLYGYKDNWRIYRSNREQLLSIVCLYFNQAGIFGKKMTQEERDIIFIETCEKCFQEEVTDWRNINK